MNPHHAPPDDHSPGLTTAEAARRLAEAGCNARSSDPSNGWPTMLAGTAPIPASSGTTVRYRLNRSGDRKLNQAIHRHGLAVDPSDVGQV